MADHEPVTVLLSRVMADVQAVGKDSQNQQQGFRFRGIDAVVNAVGPALREHGVIVLPEVESVEYETYQTRSGTTMRGCYVRVRYTFVGPGADTLECVVLGESSDAGDKSTTKALSVAYRNALLQSLCIPTDEPDPDEHVVERAAPAPHDPVRAAKRTLLVELQSRRPDLDEDTAKALAGQLWVEFEEDPNRLTEMFEAIPEGAS